MMHLVDIIRFPNGDSKEVWSALPPLTPKPVLKSGVIYSADNGELICLECAGMSAKFTGFDRSGQSVEAVPNTAESRAQWRAAFGKDLACEAGCTKYS